MAARQDAIGLSLGDEREEEDLHDIHEVPVQAN
jgi:hypothetical protein